MFFASKNIKRSEKMKIKFFLSLALIFVMTLISSCSQNKSNPVSSQDFVMDTVLEQTVYGGDKNTADTVLALFKADEKRLSAFIEGSEIYKINHADGKEIIISEETFKLISKSLEYSKQSDYIFDVSVYPLSKIWKDAIKQEKLPSKQAVDIAKSRVDGRKIILNKDRNSVILGKEMALDLGAVAKGAALDSAKAVYEEKGVSGAICSLGSSAMLIYGDKNGKAFKIGLRNPFDKASHFAVLEISDAVISTSGGYERMFEVDNKSYHHIIDTKTGYPSKSDIASVTVVGDDGVFCDYMSTRLFLEGFEKAQKTVKEQGIEAVIVSNDKKVYASPSLKLTVSDNSFERV